MASALDGLFGGITVSWPRDKASSVSTVGVAEGAVGLATDVVWRFDRLGIRPYRLIEEELIGKTPLATADATLRPSVAVAVIDEEPGAPTVHERVPDPVVPASVLESLQDEGE